MCWLSGSGWRGKTGGENGEDGFDAVLDGPSVVDACDVETRRERHGPGEPRRDVGLGFAATRRKAAGEGFDGRSDFENTGGEAGGRIGENGARDVGDDTVSACQIIGDVGRDAVAETMGLPGKGIVAGGTPRHSEFMSSPQA